MRKTAAILSGAIQNNLFSDDGCPKYQHFLVLYILALSSCDISKVAGDQGTKFYIWSFGDLLFLFFSFGDLPPPLLKM